MIENMVFFVECKLLNDTAKIEVGVLVGAACGMENELSRFIPVPEVLAHILALTL
jgi:hypothetical protein